MEADAEALFDYLGKRYEDAFAKSPNLCDFVEQAARKLPPHSRVLDVGSGTGRPVANILAAAGHQVHGIDVSQTMVDIASNQVAGAFTKKDMREYQPNSLFDGVFVILSLFQITPGETYSMCYKFCEWLKPGGFVLVGVTPSNYLTDNSYVYDLTWDCARQLRKPWMNKYTNETFFSQEGWRMMLQSAGFAIESEVCYTFTPDDPNHTQPEVHLLLLARKVEELPLLGPYPLPIELSAAPSSAQYDYFSDRLESDSLHFLLRSIYGQKVLSLGAFGKWTGAAIEHFNGSLDVLPFASGSFDVILVPWKLDTVIDIRKSLKEIARVVRKASNSQIIIIQGAPENEFVQFLNTTPSLPKSSHQGRVISAAMDILAGEGFADTNLTRIDGNYMFPEESVAERCELASKLLVAGNSLNGATELLSRLELHFKGSKHTIGAQMIMLQARLLPN